MLSRKKSAFSKIQTFFFFFCCCFYEFKKKASSTLINTRRLQWQQWFWSVHNKAGIYIYIYNIYILFFKGTIFLCTGGNIKITVLYMIWAKITRPALYILIKYIYIYKAEKKCYLTIIIIQTERFQTIFTNTLCELNDCCDKNNLFWGHQFTKQLEVKKWQCVWNSMPQMACIKFTKSALSSRSLIIFIFCTQHL